MKIVIRYLIVQCLFFVSFVANAHQPDLSSTLLVEQDDNSWILHIRAALTAFEYEVEHHFGAASYTSPEAFKELVVKHVEGNIALQFNGNNTITLQNGMVKLGHETSVTFEVLGTPDAIQTLKVMNNSFRNIPRNQSALIVLKEGFSKDQFTLNNNNKHTAELKVSNSKFVLVSSAKTQLNYLLILIIAIAICALTIGYFAINTRKSVKLNTQFQTA